MNALTPQPTPDIEPDIGPDLGPDWFRRAIALPTTACSVESRGVRLRYRCWNVQDVQKPGLLFVHGYRGHARWWDCIAPYFIDRYRVYAMDLSGMGDSDWRDRYTLEAHALDIADVLQHASIRPATLIGHSYGGGRVLRLCADQPQWVERALVLDSYVSFTDIDPPEPMRQPGRTAAYPSYEAARARYRLLPDQPAEPWLLDYIARHSLTAVKDGWDWKFDRTLPFGVPEDDGPALLSRIEVPVDIVVGEHSRIVDASRASRIASHLKHGRGPVVIPEAGHHLMLDQPLATIAVLRALLC